MRQRVAVRDTVRAGAGPGAQGEHVREAQYLLARYHLLRPVQVDGLFGEATEEAVRDFQTDRGLAVDGVVGPLTWRALLAVFGLPPILRVGSRGDVVRRLQQALEERRQDFASGLGALGDDGIYGPHTEEAVRALQRRTKVTVDGIVGPQTWAVQLGPRSSELATVVGV